MTKSQVDKLGELLKSGRRDQEVIQLLGSLYVDYEPVAEKVSGIIQDYLAKVNVVDVPLFSKRPTKTRQSIVAKLRREHTRLSTMQDIIGCRIIVQNRIEQDLIVTGFRPPRGEWVSRWPTEPPIGDWPVLWSGPFPKSIEIDRGGSPRSGYRARHVVVRDYIHPYEIQVRTIMQNRWAQLSERLDDVYPGIKYGRGPATVQQHLIELSEFTEAAEHEEEEALAEWERPELGISYWDEQRSRVAQRFSELSRLFDAFELGLV